jgi:hypothetical protein
LLLRGTLIIPALLRLPLLAFAFSAALLVFNHVLPQLPIAAEEPPVGDYKVGFLLFFWHKIISPQRHRGTVVIFDILAAIPTIAMVYAFRAQGHERASPIFRSLCLCG